MVIAQANDTWIKLNGNLYSLHSVGEKENIYSISRQYEMEVSTFKQLNRITDPSYNLQYGELVIVTHSTPSTTPSIATDEVIHIVTSKETLYSVAKKYDTTVEKLTEYNQLTTPELKIGQSIKIPGNTQPVGGTDIIKQEVQVGNVSVQKNEEKKPSIMDLESSKTIANTETISPTDDKREEANVPEVKEYDHVMLLTLKNKFEMMQGEKYGEEIKKCAAGWVKDETVENLTKFYALSNVYAPGTIIQVKNLMNNKVTFVKVLGKLGEGDLSNNVEVKVSAAAAHVLDVKDGKFVVELTAKLLKTI